MRHSLSLLAILTCIALLCTGCSTHATAVNPDTFRYADGSWPQQGQALERANNIDPIEDLITKQYSPTEIMDILGNQFIQQTDHVFRVAGQVTMLGSLEEPWGLPPECIRTLSNDRFYVVYQLDNGDRLFAFFKKFSHSSSDYWPVLTTTLYWSTSAPPTITQTGIITLQQAAEFDPWIKLAFSGKQVTNLYRETLEPNKSFFTLHPYKNGIVQYTYTPTDPDKSSPSDPTTQVTVTRTVHTDFIFTWQGCDFDCSVLAKDIPT